MHEIYLEKLGGPGVSADHGIAVTRFPCIVGRHPECQHYLEDSSVSRRHCLLFAMSNLIWVQDLGSSNGTYVNEDQIEEARPLRDGYTLRLGQVAFEVQFPLQADTPAVMPVVLPQTTKMTGKPHHVLVVEDNADSARSLALLLEAWGHEVVVAQDGPEALKAARERPLDFVLMDLRLPGMDGYHVAQQLRFEGQMTGARFVAITGYGPPRDDSRAAAAAFDHVLTKPVDPHDLEKLLRQAT